MTRPESASDSGSASRLANPSIRATKASDARPGAPDLSLSAKPRQAHYFCGHDHDLQHLEFEGVRTSFVDSGGGGASITKLKKPERKPYSESTYGFSHLLVTKDQLTLRHTDPAQKQLHTFTRNLAGKVDIIT